MSQIGSTITIDELVPGQSWALIAHSAIDCSTGGTGCGGIMAGSCDIEAIIKADGIENLFIFPMDREPAGLYLWRGTLDEDSDQIGTTERLHPESMQHWLDNNGRKP
jgi:hypothetical protein